MRQESSGRGGRKKKGGYLSWMRLVPQLIFILSPELVCPQIIGCISSNRHKCCQNWLCCAATRDTVSYGSCLTGPEVIESLNRHCQREDEQQCHGHSELGFPALFPLKMGLCVVERNILEKNTLLYSRPKELMYVKSKINLCIIHQSACCFFWLNFT